MTDSYKSIKFMQHIQELALLPVRWLVIV